MHTGTRRGLGMAAIAAVVASGLAYGFWPRPEPVDFATVERGLLRVTVDDEGKTRVKEAYVVSAPVGGRLLRIERHVGDEVKAGETVVATIQPRAPAFLDVRSRAQAEAAVRAAEAAKSLAEAEVERVQAALDFALADLERTRTLAARATASRRALDRAELEVKTERAALATAGAGLRVKQFELETARAALIDPAIGAGAAGGAQPSAPCCVDVVAPVDGRVLELLQESETVVEAGQKLVEIGDPRELEIIADLLSSDAVRVAEGAAVMVEEWGGGKTLAGVVRRIEPTGFTKVSALGIDEQRVNVIIDLLDPAEQWRQLGHGYRVEVRIVVWEDPEALILPSGALFREGDRWAVFAEKDRRARLRLVEIGRGNGLQAELLEGLVEGDRVVLHPSDRIADGSRVSARPQR